MKYQCTCQSPVTRLASNKTAYRLLIFQLMESIKVAVLCAPEPSLELALSHVVRFWSIVTDDLKSLSHSLPRNLPLSLNMESSVLALLMLNLETHKCLNVFTCPAVQPLKGVSSVQVQIIRNSNCLTQLFLQAIRVL